MAITESSPATRTVDGVELPAPGVWQIDPSHSTVEFIARHLMVSKVRGRISDFDGAVRIADEPLASSVELTMQAASIDTNSEDRDAHLRSADFFDVDEHPTMAFRSTAVEPAGHHRWSVQGELTIKGISRPVELDLELLGFGADPWGAQRAVYSARAEVDREDWGLTWNTTLESGGVLVSKAIQIELEIQTVFSG